MESSGSDTEIDCFESAEESLDDNSESESTKITSKISAGKSESEVDKPVVSITTDSLGQVEENVSKNLLSYRKRPERVKRSISKSSSQPITKSVSNEVTFNPDKIVPDVFFQDITSHLSKNFNKSLNTLQQTSSNVKDLILNSLPVSSVNYSESFAYDDKNVSFSLAPEDKISNIELNAQMETQPEVFENTTGSSAVLEEENFNGKLTVVEREENSSVIDTVNENDTIPKLYDLKTDNINEENYKLDDCILNNIVEKKLSNFCKEDAGRLYSGYLSSDSANNVHENHYQEVMKTRPESTEKHLKESYEISCIKNPGKICDKQDAANDELSKTDSFKVSGQPHQQNEESQCTESINFSEILSEELHYSEDKYLISLENDILKDEKNNLIYTEVIEGSDNLDNSKSKMNLTNYSNDKKNVDSDCNLEELKLALKNIVREDKIVSDDVNKVSGNIFPKTDFNLDEKINVHQISNDGWDDFDFSDDEFENVDQGNTNKLPEIGKDSEKQVEDKESVAEVKYPIGNIEMPTKKSRDSDLSLKNVKTVKSTDLNIPKNNLMEKNNKEVENPKQPIESKPVSDDFWDWDDWDENTKGKRKSIDSKPTEKSINKRNTEAEFFDVSNWSGWDTFGQKPQEKQGNWNLGSWGMDVLLNKATAVTQGLSSVLEAGLGAPDPETLARLEKQEREKFKDLISEQTVIENEHPDECSKKNSLTNVSLFPVSGITSLVAGVTSKIVEHSKIQEIGSKVITGGLDTLETLGKKTMEVLQEGDPGLKNKSALLLGNNKPVLSQVLREAREKAEKEMKQVEEKELAKKCHFETLFDDFQGMVHLEALEMLSRQCELKLDQIKSGMNSEELEDLNGILEEVEQLCSLDEYDTDMKSSVLDFKTALQMAVEPLKNEISIQRIIQVYEDANKWLEMASKTNPSIIIMNQKLVSILAELAAATVHQFHKSGELLSVKECRKTVEEVDVLSRLTNILCKEINRICDKFVLLPHSINCIAATSENVNSFNEKVTFVMQNSTMYIRQAFDLLIPVIQLGAAV